MTKPRAKTIEMTEAQWNAWEKHLYSGEIKQGKEMLINDKGAMCCLGVLEYALEGKVEPKLGFPSDNFLIRNNIRFKNVFDTDSLDSPNYPNSPYLTDGYAHELNDISKLTFKQIAHRLKSRIKFIEPKEKS